MWKKDLNPEEAAQIIERFLKNESRYPQEWNDFVDTPQQDKTVERHRLQCYELDPLVNRPGGPDPIANKRLESIVESLRSYSNPTCE